MDLAALGHNAQVLRNTLAPGTELMAVVKAEAYGHGGAVTARTLQRAGVRAFAVACLAEGIALRKAGIRGTILILGYTSPEEAPLLTRWHLTQTVADIDHGRALAARGRRVHVHLALDTGMHRLGILAENRKEILEAFRLPNLVVDGVFSHLYVSDSLEAEDVAYTQEQLTLFYDTVAWLRTAGYDPGKVHIQSSYGLWNLPAQPCDYVRAGIALYGVRSDDAPVQRSLDLRPVLSLRARVASIRTVQAGESAGYGRVFQAEQETKLAVVTIGYADGLPRDLPQRGGQVLIQGRRCPMVGWGPVAGGRQRSFGGRSWRYSNYYRPGWRSGDSGRGTGCMLWDDYQRTALPVRHAVTHCFWLKSGREFYKDSGSDFNMNIPLNRNSHQPR